MSDEQIASIVAELVGYEDVEKHPCGEQLEVHITSYEGKIVGGKFVSEPDYEQTLQLRCPKCGSVVASASF